jgi:hypothetical protein
MSKANIAVLLLVLLRVCPLQVFIGGMPYSYSREQVAEYWGWCGEIESLDCMTFPDTGRFRCGGVHVAVAGGGWLRCVWRLVNALRQMRSFTRETMVPLGLRSLLAYQSHAKQHWPWQVCLPALAIRLPWRRADTAGSAVTDDTLPPGSLAQP